MRLAQPVLRRMLRTWLAAVCSLINSAAPISRLLRPRATRRRISTSRDERPSGSASGAAGGSGPIERMRASSARRPMASAIVAASLSSGDGARGVAAREPRAGVLVERVAEPRQHPGAPVEHGGVQEVRLGALPLAERRGEHAEVAVGRAVAGDEVADHHVRAGQRLELRVDERRGLRVAQRGAGVGQVGERRQPQRLAQAVQAIGADLLELVRAPRRPCRARRARRRAPGATAHCCPADRRAAGSPARARRAGPARGGCRTSGSRARPRRRGRSAAGSSRASGRASASASSSRPSQSAIAEP